VPRSRAARSGGLFGPLEAAEPVAGVGEGSEEVAHARKEAPGRGRLVLSPPDLGEGERGVGDQLPGSQPLHEGDPALDFPGRCGQLAAPA